MPDIPSRKTLGQHWLNDEATLHYICDCANLSLDDTVLEIGPGTGTLTKKLLATGAKVVAVEKDESLANNFVKGRTSHISVRGPTFHKPSGLEVVAGDILAFDLSRLPPSYKVVANIPYYLTSNLLRVLSESKNPPELMVLLVQKEVAERIATGPGQMSLLTVSVQLYYQPKLGKIVPAKLFDPPPKVDSQIVILKRRQKPLLAGLDTKQFFRIVKAGFSQRRKKLRSSLSGGLGISKQATDDLLKTAGINGEQRAQELSLDQWYQLYSTWKKLP